MRPEAHCKSTNAPAKSNWRKKDKKQNDEKVKTPQPKKKKEAAAKHNGKQRKKETKKKTTTKFGTKYFKWKKFCDNGNVARVCTLVATSSGFSNCRKRSQNKYIEAGEGDGGKVSYFNRDCRNYGKRPKPVKEKKIIK